MASLVCALILQRRIRTTLMKAKCARSLAEQLVTEGKKGTLAARRSIISILRRKEVAKVLFDSIIPHCQERKSGYTRIVKLGIRQGDGAAMVYLEWVNLPPPERKKAPKKSGEAEPKR